MPQASPATTASPTRSVPRCTSIVATGPRPTSRRDSMIGPDASAFGFAVSSSSASATSRIFSSSSSRFSFCFAETSENCVAPPHSSGCSPSAASSLRTRSGLASGTSILFTATTIGTSAARGVRDRLLRLRHDAVVCGHDEHGDVRHLRAAGAHRRERLVAGRVEEGDAPSVDLGLVGADVLRDPAGLGLDDRGLADRVEQRRLAVVDVTHDRHDGRSGLEILRRVLVDLGLLVLLGGVLDRDLALELGRDQLDLLVAEALRDLNHVPEAHHDLDQLGRRNAECLREIPDGDARGDGHGPVGCAGACCFGRGSVRSRGCRESCRGRAAPLSMTTRRRPLQGFRGAGSGGWVCSEPLDMRQSV